MKRRADRSGRCAAAAVLVLGAAVAAAADFATETPEAAVSTLHRGLVELSAAEPDASLERRYEVLEPLILATHDLPYIAEFALRRQWPELSESDRRRFTAAFQRLSVMTYAARFSKVSSGTFKLGEGRPSASGRAEIAAAVVRPDASEVALEYLLHEREAQWKIINVIADGVSDLALKRAEYQRVLSSGSIDDLIRYVDEQTSRLQ